MYPKTVHVVFVKSMLNGLYYAQGAFVTLDYAKNYVSRLEEWLVPCQIKEIDTDEAIRSGFMRVA